MKLAEKVKEFFHNEGIHSTTIQPEFVEVNEVSGTGIQSGSISDFSSIITNQSSSC
jgi:zinc transporter 1